MKRGIDVALRLVAAVLLASLSAAAWHDVSKAFDGWYYHLPFAARIAGIVDPSSYAFSPANEARFRGFPLLAEAAQGLLWRITGRVECANFVALASIPALVWALRRLHAVPPHLALLALVAVPLVQIHATASYVDLPANTCATLLLLLSHRAVIANAPPSPRQLALAATLAAATVNTKFQLVPIAAVGALPLVVLSLRAGAERRARLAVLALALPLVFATPIKNLALYGNPVWPVQLGLLPHLERAYASSPDWLEHAPRPARFLCSIFEIGLRPIASHRRWSLDQWTPPSEAGFRMGGFFGAYVAANVAGLILAAIRRRSREVRVSVAFAIGVTIVTSLMPQSHELRYYLVWMLLLVSMNLALWARERPASVGLVAAAALGVVAWSTEAAYLYPSGDRFEALLAAKVDARVLDGVGPGEQVCVARPPWTFLWAPVFHPGRRYSVQEAEDRSDCASARPLD